MHVDINTRTILHMFDSLSFSQMSYQLEKEILLYIFYFYL